MSASIEGPEQTLTAEETETAPGPANFEGVCEILGEPAPDESRSALVKRR